MAVRDSDFVQMVNTNQLATGDDLSSLKKLMEEENRKEEEEEEHSGLGAGRKARRGRLKCMACHPGDECGPGDTFVCHDAVACFTAHVRDTGGVVSKSKGQLFMCILYKSANCFSFDPDSKIVNFKM